MVFYNKENKSISSFALRIIGLLAILADYSYTYLVQGQRWQMHLEWFAFTIFAFLLAEGFVKTSDRRLYAVRLFLFAAISEIPYNLMVAKAISYSRDQNVMFTLGVGVLAMEIVSKVREKMNNTVLTGLTAVITTALCSWFSMSLGFDMASCGLIIIMICYMSMGLKYKKAFLLAAFLIMIPILTSDYIVSPNIGGYLYYVPVEALSLPALLLIFCYKGNRGPNGLWAKRLFYILYPAICLGVALLAK